MINFDSFICSINRNIATCLHTSKIFAPIIDPLITSGGKYSESCWNNNFQACITISYIIFSIDGGAEVTCDKCIDNSSNSFFISHEPELFARNFNREAKTKQ